MMRNATTVERGRTLRKSMTPPERKRWRRLRNRHLGGIKFRRQAPMGPFIADFLSHDAKLVVELDGDSHAEAEAALRDARQSDFFARQGFRVIRFFTSEVRENLDHVVDRIRIACGLAPTG